MKDVDEMLIEGIRLCRGRHRGTVCYDEEEKVYFGKVIGINDGIVYQGESLFELKDCFNSAVDEYVNFCKENDKEPEYTI